MNVFAPSFHARRCGFASTLARMIPFLLMVAFLALPHFSLAQEAGGPAAAWAQARRAGTCRFTATLTVTLTPTVPALSTPSGRTRRACSLCNLSRIRSSVGSRFGAMPSSFVPVE